MEVSILYLERSPYHVENLHAALTLQFHGALERQVV